MAHAITIPKLGLTMTDCTLVTWSKNDGDRVEKGELLYAIETEKITSDIESDGEGYLKRLAAVDSVHAVGAVIGRLHATRSEAIVAAPDSAPTPTAAIAEAAAEPRSRARISPLARRIAAAAGLDASALNGTGAGGAVLKRDVEAAIVQHKTSGAPHTQIEELASKSSSRPQATGSGTAPRAARRPLTGMRRAIAQKMMQSLQRSAQMTGFGRVDMGEAARLRKACIKAEFQLGVRVSFTDIVLKASAAVLASMPEINASIIDDEIVTWADVNIGLAVSLDDGLIVPVIRNADNKTIAEIAHERIDIAARGRSGQLRRDELEGGTFSLSNFGSYGGDFETPILNAPQSALLGVGAITDEPVVRNGEIVIRPMMTISLTFDHRLIDGAVAGRFRSRLKSMLENPFSMMATMR